MRRSAWLFILCACGPSLARPLVSEDASTGELGSSSSEGAEDSTSTSAIESTTGTSTSTSTSTSTGTSTSSGTSTSTTGEVECAPREDAWAGFTVAAASMDAGCYVILASTFDTGVVQLDLGCEQNDAVVEIRVVLDGAGLLAGFAKVPQAGDELQLRYESRDEGRWLFLTRSTELVAVGIDASSLTPADRPEFFDERVTLRDSSCELEMNECGAGSRFAIEVDYFFMLDGHAGNGCQYGCEIYFPIAVERAFRYGDSPCGPGEFDLVAMAWTGGE